MPTMQEAVRRLRIEATAKGVNESAASLQRLGQAHKGVTVESRKQERATLSMERRLDSIQRKFDTNYRSKQALAKVTRDLSAAEAQGLVTTARKNELLALATQRYNTAGAASKKFIADLEFERAQLKRSAVQQAIHNNLRRAGVAAASAEGAAIAKVTAALHAETAARARRNQLVTAVGSAGAGLGLGGAGLGAAAAPLAVAGSLIQFARFEQALVGVGKTTDITGDQLAELGRDVQLIAREVPVATTELLGIAQAAGQLGVKGNANILAFTETVGKLGLASNLAGEEAATALARILTVTGTDIGDVDRLGSTIVRLGNNFAATEAEIAEMSTRVAQATAQFDVSAAEVAGIGTALKAVGVQAEAGGTVIGRVFQAINDAVRQGGDELETFTRITGKSGDELKRLFQDDPTTAFQVFVEGLGRVKAEGGDVAAALDAVGLDGVRIIQVMGTLASRSNVLADALRQANEEWDENNALNEEARRAADTLTSKFQLLRNEVGELATATGEDLSPAALGFIEAARNMIRSTGEFSQTVDDLVDDPNWDNFVRFLVGDEIAAHLGIDSVTQRMKELNRQLEEAGDNLTTISKTFPAGPNTTTIAKTPRAKPDGGGDNDFGGDDDTNEFTRATDTIRQQIEAMRIEAETFGMAERAAARYRVEQQLLYDAKEAGITLSAEERQRISDLAEAYANYASQIDQLQERYRTLEDVANTVTGNMGRAFDDFLENGRINFRGFVNDLLKDLARLALQKTLLEPLAEGLSGSLGNIFGGGVDAAVLHDGGYAGFGGRSRYVHPAYFEDAPRYHNGGIAGLRPNEVPAILERGEPVGAMAGRGNVVVTTSVSVSVDASGSDASEPRDREALAKTVGEMVEVKVNAVIAKNLRLGGMLNKTL